MTLSTLRQHLLDDKVCSQIDLGLIQEVIPPSLVEDLLTTYDLWEEKARQLNMKAMVYWMIALNLYPHLSQRAVYAKLVSGLRTIRDDVGASIPARSAFSYRREQLGSDLLEELFRETAAPQASQETTPTAFWRGLRLLALDGTLDPVADTWSNWQTFCSSTDDPASRSPFPLARLVLLVECATHLICDAELSHCRQGEATSQRLLLERHRLDHCLLLWDSGFHSSAAIFQVCQRGGEVLGRLRSPVLRQRVATLGDGSYLAHLYEDQEHPTGNSRLVRVMESIFTDPRFPGAGEQVSRLVTTLLSPFQYPAKALAVLYHERWHAEVVIGETRTALRLSSRTLRSLTAQGVIQEIFALLLAHNVIRTLMLRAAIQAEVAPTQLSYTAAIRLLDDSLIPLGLVTTERRAHLVENLIRELGYERLPTQRLRLQSRVVKRVRSRYERKTPEHWHVAPFEVDLDFHHVIALVT